MFAMTEVRCPQPPRAGEGGHDTDRRAGIRYENGKGGMDESNNVTSYGDKDNGKGRTMNKERQEGGDREEKGEAESDTRSEGKMGSRKIAERWTLSLSPYGKPPRRHARPTRAQLS